MSSYLHTQAGRHGNMTAGQLGCCEEAEGVPVPKTSVGGDTWQSRALIG